MRTRFDVEPVWLCLSLVGATEAVCVLALRRRRRRRAVEGAVAEVQAGDGSKGNGYKGNGHGGG